MARLRNGLVAVCAALALLCVTPALAQVAVAPDPASARVHLGPLMMNPTIVLDNLGIDNNVFNDPVGEIPKRDFTLSVTPKADFWVRLGPTWASASLSSTLVWYQEYASERSANDQYKLGWNVPGSVMSFTVNWAYDNVHERPGFEIDTRAGRKDETYSGAVEYHALSKTYVGVSGSRKRTRFASDAQYDGTNLDTSLNRVNTTAAVNVRHQLAPLTNLTLSVTRLMDRFEFSPERDSDATTAQATIAFLPGALLKGSFTLGYSAFRPVDPDLPGYTGPIGTASLSAVLLGTTKFGVTGSRGVEYSYDVNQPYYVRTGIAGSITQQIFGPFDLEARAGTEMLAYRDLAGAAVEVANRTDYVNTFGAGVGYHMGRSLRLAFNVDKVKRDSQLADHQYDNFKFGTALSTTF